MKDRQASASGPQPTTASQKGRPVFLAAARVRLRTQSLTQSLMSYRDINKYILFAVLLTLLTTLVVVVYYVNHPQPAVAPDSEAYLGLTYRIQTTGRLVDPYRVPGFPLLMVLVFALTGQNNLLAVTLVQGFLFVLTTLEFYLIAVLILRRGWLAFLVSLLVGTNMLLLFYAKAILSESLSLWLLTSLTLVAVLFVYTSRPRYLWLASGLSIPLFFTRPEWFYLPVPLFAYLLLVAVRRGIGRRLLGHVLVCMLLPYAFLGWYIYVDATQNHFVGVTATQNIDSWGKVLEYGMQNEAPPEYAKVTQIVDTYLAHDISNPQNILYNDPFLQGNYYELAGAYARAIILRHPVEFLTKSTGVGLWSLTYIWVGSLFQVTPTGAFSTPLLGLESISRTLYGLNALFPVGAAIWLFLLFWRRTARLRSVQAMGVVILLALCGLTFTTLGGIEDYMRLHTPFNPLLILVVWGTLLSGAVLVVRAIARRGVGVIWTELDRAMNVGAGSVPVTQNTSGAIENKDIKTSAAKWPAGILVENRARAGNSIGAFLTFRNKKKAPSDTRASGKRAWW